MNALWNLIEHSSKWLALLALLLPFLGLGVGLWLGARRRSPDGSYQTGRLASFGCAAGIVAAVVLLFVALTLPPPGAGARSAELRAQAESLIERLHAYRLAHGGYPPSLDELSAEAPSLAGQVEYRQVGSGFAITYRYFGPGVNRCTFETPDSTWHCSGYY